MTTPRRRNLNSEVRKILQEPWTVQRSRGAPRAEDLGLDNEGRTINAAVLYADLDESTRMAETQQPEFAGRMYKTYLVCAARVIRSEQGNITAYDGDRIMAVYTGRRMVERAVRSALKLNYVVQEIVNPAVQELTAGTRFAMRQSIGVDVSELLVAKTGIRTANDLVWVGRAANYSAKLSSRRAPATHITSEVYEQLPDELKRDDNGRQMWTPETAAEIGHRRVYSSSWWCRF